MVICLDIGQRLDSDSLYLAHVQFFDVGIAMDRYSDIDSAFALTTWNCLSIMDILLK